ncbi:MAG: hypothetical protein J5851_10975 [Oscillospiraceae bacterium]|nr:hypothetical protein [Oscillospiraceae bacterium]
MMELEEMLRDLRYTKDADLLQQIVTDYPTGDPAKLFEKSYRNHQKQTQPASTSFRNRRNILYKTIGIAACLLFSVGIGLGLHRQQQKIEPLLPQEPTHAATTEPSAETASQEALQTCMNTTAAESTETVADIAEETGTTDIPESSASETEQAHAEPAPTRPAATSAPTEAAVSISETEPLPTEPTEPESTSGTDAVILDESLLPWFVIEEVNGVTRIRYMQEVEPSPAEWVTYAVEAEQFTLTDVRHHSTSCEYRITAAETEQTLTVYQYERTALVRLWDTELNAEVVFIHEHPGCAWTDANGKCGLLWDDGQYTFVVETAEENADILPILAKSIRS